MFKEILSSENLSVSVTVGVGYKNILETFIFAFELFSASVTRGTELDAKRTNYVILFLGTCSTPISWIL